MVNREEQEQLCCGNCTYPLYNKNECVFVCNNEESEYFGFPIEYDDSCLDFNCKY